MRDYLSVQVIDQGTAKFVCYNTYRKWITYMRRVLDLLKKNQMSLISNYFDNGKCAYLKEVPKFCGVDDGLWHIIFIYTCTLNVH